MKRMICRILGLTILAAGFSAAGVTNEASAEVRVEVNIGPPVIMVEEPSEVVFAPDLGVYFVPDSEMEIFYYRGFWWSRRGIHWYHSRYYRRGWQFVMDREVPRQVFRVPVDYREKFGRERHIRFRDWKEPRYQPEKGVKNLDKRATGRAGGTSGRGGGRRH